MFDDFDTQVQCEEAYDWQPSDEDWAAVNADHSGGANPWMAIAIAMPWLLASIAFKAMGY